jgi:putative spermidine/putrescine transport system permease protein
MKQRQIGMFTKVSAIAVLLFLAIPILIIFPLALNSSDYLTFPPQGFSLRWVTAVLSNPDWIESSWLSLKIATMSTGLSAAISIPTALALVRGKLPFKQGIYALILLPMIVPNVIAAIAMFFFFANLTFLSAVSAIVLGHVVLSVPIAVIILSSTLQGVDRRLEQAALSMGASPLTTFQRVTLPLISPGIASAAIFAFLSSFDELLVAMYLGNHGAETLPVRIWSSVNFQLDPSIAAVSALLVLVSVSALLGANFFSSRFR